MRASTIRFLNLLASLGLLLAAIFVFTLLLKPAYREINVLRGDLAVKTSTLTDQKKIVAEVREYLDRYQSLVGHSQKISLTLPNREEYPNLINQLSGLARISGLALQSVTLATLPYQKSGTSVADSAPVVNIIQATLSLSGSYQSFKNLLQSIETNIRLMDAVSFSLNPGTGGDNYSYNLVVNAYYQSL